MELIGPMSKLENLGRYTSRNTSKNIVVLFQIYILKK